MTKVLSVVQRPKYEIVEPQVKIRHIVKKYFLFSLSGEADEIRALNPRNLKYQD